jgi:hypothetical protein
VQWGLSTNFGYIGSAHVINLYALPLKVTLNAVWRILLHLQCLMSHNQNVDKIQWLAKQKYEIHNLISNSIHNPFRILDNPSKSKYPVSLLNFLIKNILEMDKFYFINTIVLWQVNKRERERPTRPQDSTLLTVLHCLPAGRGIIECALSV